VKLNGLRVSLDSLRKGGPSDEIGNPREKKKEVYFNRKKRPDLREAEREEETEATGRLVPIQDHPSPILVRIS